MNYLTYIRELLQSLCLILHAILIFRITLRLNNFVELFELIRKGNHIVGEQFGNYKKMFEIVNERLENLEKKEK